MPPVSEPRWSYQTRFFRKSHEDRPIGSSRGYRWLSRRGCCFLESRYGVWAQGQGMPRPVNLAVRISLLPRPLGVGSALLTFARLKTEQRGGIASRQVVLEMESLDCSTFRELWETAHTLRYLLGI